MTRITEKTMRKLKKGDIIYVACKVDAVFIESGMIQVSTRDCDNGFDAYEDEVLDFVETKLPTDIELMKKNIKTLEQQKVGEWFTQNDGFFEWYECSNCGYVVEGEMQHSGDYDARTNYCPNCGAKMKSE